MSRFRASIALASLVASLVMTAGVTTLSTEAASAAPHDPYPPTASALTVNRGTVRVGSSVRATGNGFRSHERIRVTVLYRPLYWDHYTTVLQNYGIHAGRQGNFSVKVQMYLPGTAIIKAYGVRSGRSASAPVRVLLFGHGLGGWLISRAGYTYSGRPEAASPVITSTVASPAPAETPADPPAVALAGLGVFALVGSALITRRTMRRRRKAVVND
jgi:hypothetical protein